MISFYKAFKDFYKMGRHIDFHGQTVNVMGNNLINSIAWARNFIQNYANTRISYEKSIHFLGSSFGRLFGGIQFGFKATNPDVDKYKKGLLENAKKIAAILKTISPGLKLVYIPQRILHIYQDDFKNVHFFMIQFAQELSR